MVKNMHQSMFLCIIDFNYYVLYRFTIIFCGIVIFHLLYLENPYNFSLSIIYIINIVILLYNAYIRTAPLFQHYDLVISLNI